MKKKMMIAALTAMLSAGAMAVPAMAHNGEDHSAVPQVAEGQGVVKAVDPKAQTIVIQHGPIAALKWPAMTMKFKVASPALLKGVSVGKKIHFVLKNVGGKPVVSQIHLI